MFSLSPSTSDEPATGPLTGVPMPETGASEALQTDVLLMTLKKNEKH